MSQIVVIRTNGTSTAVTPSGGWTISDTGVSTLGAVTALTVANEASDTTCFPLFATAATGDLGPKSNAALTFNSATGNLGVSGITATGAISVGGSGSFIMSGATSGSVGIGAKAIAGTADLDFSGTADGFLIESATTSLKVDNTDGLIFGGALTMTKGTNTFTIANGTASLTMPAASAVSITGGGTISLGGFALTVPATGTAALLSASNTYTGTTNTFTLPTSTGTTTTSGIAIAGNSLTTGTGVYIASTSLTSGKIIDIQVSGTVAAAGHNVFNLLTTGANGTSAIATTAATIANTHSGTTSRNTALTLTASGGATENTALNITAGDLRVAFYTSGLVFGTGVVFGAGAYMASVSGTSIRIGANGAEQFGVRTEGVGLKNGGAMVWSASGDTSNVSYTTNISESSAGVLRIGTTAVNALGSLACAGITASGALITTPQALSGAGAVDLTTASTAFTSTGGAQALTLANGTSGQIKRICHVVDGGSGVLTPTTKSGYTTITFTNVGDSVTLQYHTTAGWCITGIFGAVAA